MANILPPLFFRVLLLLLLSGTVAGLQAQNKYTLSGYIKDASSGEDLVGARVLALEQKAGAFTNEYGFYSLTLPQGNYTIIISYLSFSSDTIRITLDKDITLSRELGEKEIKIKEVEISDKIAEQNVKSLEMSTQTVNVEMVKKLPALLGEVDVIRMIDLLPGVQGVGEGITGYYVRGGQSNQNLILLDEATVYNASHVLGFFSVFNSDALKDEYKLYKGGIPAQFGGRLSSVLDLRMKEGNSKQFHAQGGIGLISSRASLEAPIIKDKASFMISGRRTYGDLFLLTAKDDALRDTRAYFYDLNAKMNFKFSDKDRLFLSGYFGRDVFKFRDQFSNDWGNATGTLRWNHLFSDKLFSNTTLIFSDFTYGFEIEAFAGERFKYRAGIRDYSLKSDFNWFANAKNNAKFGIELTAHDFTPGIFEPVGESFLQEYIIPNEYAGEAAIYANNEQEITSRISLLYGLRFSAFANMGPGTEYSYENDRETIKDSTVYDDFQIMNLYYGLEPRAAVRYTLTEMSSLKASYNRMRQYLHLASNSAASFPWDIWIPSSIHIKPQIADQVAVGYFRNFFKNNVEGSIELYYKWMQNQMDFKNGAELILNPTIETELLFGKGYSYGAEFFIKKKTGRLTGWIGYTLAWSRRVIEGINDGEAYPASNDRRHDVSVVAQYALTKRINLSMDWVYATGNAVTFPQGKYVVNGFTLPYYGPRNGARMPDYHRMDFSLYIDPKEKPEKEGKRRLESGWNFSVYNVYGRRNAWAISFRESEDNPGTTEAVKLFLFRWVPSVTWNFKF